MKKTLTLTLVVLLIAAPVAAQAALWDYTGNSYGLAEDSLVAGGYQGNDGNIYILGNDNDSVFVYDTDYNYQGISYDVSGQTGLPTDLVQNDSRYWFVVGGQNEMVHVYDPAFSYTGTSYSVDNDLNNPDGITIGPDGNFYIIGEIDDQVFEYDSNFSTVVNTYSVTAGASGLAYGNDGFFYTNDATNETIIQYNGSFVETGSTYDYSNQTTTGDGIFETAEGFWYILSSDTAYEYGGTEAPDPNLETNLDLEIDPWMPFNSQQNYRVILNETNTTTGVHNMTDVTATANVTIYNITNTTGFSEPIATVNNTTDTIRSYNETGVVAVNATYDGNTVANASNLTVGNRNLSNIGIMPPEEWVCSFLICDENPSGGDNPHNIGSSMQWLLLIIVIMVAATRFVENPWAGVGTGIMFSIFIWVLEFIDLGSVLVTVFSGLLIGVMMARTQMGRGVTRDNEQSGIAATQVRNRNE